jgi:outer membrane lipoprotein LolB
MMGTFLTNLLRSLVVLSVLLFLSACAPKRPKISTDQAEHVQGLHDQQVSSEQDFSLSGRIGIKSKNDGGSGSFDWLQRGDVIAFELRAPLSNQTWRLEGLPGSFELTNSKGEVKQNADAKQLLLDASGWLIPIEELRHWVRGARAPEALSGKAQVSFAASGDLQQLRQNGWIVEFERFEEIDGKRLPVKLKAYQDGAQVKLLIKAWE